MNIAMCPDTRNLAPQDARTRWWELQTGTYVGGVCRYFLGVKVFGTAPAERIWSVLGFDDVQAFTSPQGRDAYAQTCIKSMRGAGLHGLTGPAALAERQRVWRVG